MVLMFIIDGDTHPPKLLNRVILSAAKDPVLMQYIGLCSC